MIRIAFIFLLNITFAQEAVTTDCCWHTYNLDVVIQEVVNDKKAHAIKPGAKVVFLKITEGGTYKIVFLDTDQGESKLKIEKCPGSVKINAYRAKGRLKVIGNCQVNFINF